MKHKWLILLGGLLLGLVFVYVYIMQIIKKLCINVKLADISNKNLNLLSITPIGQKMGGTVEIKTFNKNNFDIDLLVTSVKVFYEGIELLATTESFNILMASNSFTLTPIDVDILVNSKTYDAMLKYFVQGQSINLTYEVKAKYWFIPFTVKKTVNINQQTIQKACI